ncbi:biofilm peroxide resistance protein BsmA [Enterobacter sp. Bisph1]|uniref:biofilm peroxide resistance protein BsmA n=1 Tax=Enterobacter sp. Bisph1 TaxID=1274399 RepID=UPI00057C216C|nr:biofilm peroxide resistance protein BsmA [Enterobacter sp. Bisph1]
MAIRRNEKTLRSLLYVLFAVLLSSCAGLEGKPQPAPPVSDHPLEIRRDQTQALSKIGAISVTVIGSPMDVEDAIKAKAAAARADYYVILSMDDTIFPGRWFGRALLYKQ